MLRGIREEPRNTCEAEDEIVLLLSFKVKYEFGTRYRNIFVLEEVECCGYKKKTPIEKITQIVSESECLLTKG